jgi:hypothetical protein
MVIDGRGNEEKTDHRKGNKRREGTYLVAIKLNQKIKWLGSLSLKKSLKSSHLSGSV